MNESPLKPANVIFEHELNKMVNALREVVSEELAQIESQVEGLKNVVSHMEKSSKP